MSFSPTQSCLSSHFSIRCVSGVCKLSYFVVQMELKILRLVHMLDDDGFCMKMSVLSIKILRMMS